MLLQQGTGYAQRASRRIPAITIFTTWTMASDRKLVVVLYAEAKLQKSISLPASFTISKAKQAGMEAIKEHLKILPGVPLVTLDPDCTDFYPVPRDDNTIIRTLKGDITMVVYPQPLEGQHLTPSPFVDALQSAIHEVRDVKAQQNVAPLAREESTEHYVKPADNINDILLRKFEAMEERYGHDMAELKQVISGLQDDNTQLKHDNAQLKHDMEEQRRVISGLQDDNAQLKHDMEEQRRVISGLQDDNAQLKQDNAQLKRDNAQLKYDIKELRGQLDETNRAVLG
ncbi:hypothetical protein C8R48DRAFT_94547 [Suillus tomentosus]|nr:hypothetical protein C8R48DRAFT_94547 [Suillus tomentosus]